SPPGVLGAKPLDRGSQGVAPLGKHCGPRRSRHAASMVRCPGAPLGTLHIRAPAPGRLRTLAVWFNQINTGCNQLVSTRSTLATFFLNQNSCHGFYQLILSAL